MRQTQKKKDKDKTAIVIMLCFSVVALTSIFALKANIDKINESVANVPVSEETKATQEESSDPTTTKPIENNDTTEASSNIPTVDSLENSESMPQYAFPVNHNEAAVTNPYSMDKLIYSLTLDQYMTHSGIDIQAPEDSQVVAASDGTVTAIYTDDRYGTSIEITHPGKIVTVYSNLSTSEMVEVGDVVTKGQIIGGVGSTGLFESLEPAHLHFEIIVDGSYVNPEDYISF